MPNPAVNQDSLPCSTPGRNVPLISAPSSSRRTTAVLETAPVRAPGFGFSIQPAEKQLLFSRKVSRMQDIHFVFFFFTVFEHFKINLRLFVLPKPAPSYRASGFAPDLQDFLASNAFCLYFTAQSTTCRQCHLLEAVYLC